MSDHTVGADELLAELKSQVEAYERGSATAEYSPDGRVLRANDAFAELVGVDRAGIVGTDHRAFVSPETAGSAEYTTLWEQLRSGSDLTSEFRLLWQGSGDLWIRSTWVPVRNGAGQVVKVIEYARDVTQGKRAAADAQGKIQAISRSQAVIEFDLDGHILDANENFLALVGYSRSEVVGRHHRMFVSAEDAQSQAYHQFWLRLKAGDFVSGEFRRIGQGGRDVWLQAVYNPILGVDGKPWKVVKFAVDVTAAKLANAEFEGKVAAMDRSQAIIEFDLDGHVLSANDNFLAAVGYRSAEVIRRHHRMFVSEETANSAEYADFWQRLRQGEFVSGEFHRYGKDGRDVWLQATYNPIFGLDGKPWKVVKFASDVTEAKTRNADFEGKVTAIRRSQAVIEFDLEGTVLEANDAFLDLMGYRLEEIRGRHHRMFVAADEADRPEYRAFWKMLARGEFHSAEYRRIAKDGSEVWIRATYNPILDADGKPVKVVKFANDVTAEKLRNVELAGRLAAIDRSQAVIEFDLSGRILTANENFLNTVGYTLEEIVGRHHSMFCTDDYAASTEYQDFWSSLRNGEFRSGRFHRHGKNGRDVWIQSSYNPILDLSGRPTKIIKYAYDVTTEVHLSHQLSIPA
ncbi:PAS domain-containing protein [Paractinoplanes atraurantiacus]|uniref:Methyl-accepting chemotaxis protein n=1 Tax=Paractinoplanes atraurantiacus TaxID=1036182 RepID=A0A285KUG0_9ACTN|nr:PAS domain S-box protein [Actinoplanes atraurantiacus]SNY76280.1 methyl-accepting chemotaxis protein [Actinoplanes atraurantiacus]